MYIIGFGLNILLLAFLSHVHAEEIWSWGTETPLDLKTPLPMELHSANSNIALTTTTEGTTGRNKSVTHPYNKDHDFKANSSDNHISAKDINEGISNSKVSSSNTTETVSGKTDYTKGIPTARFLGFSNKLCMLGIGRNCNKNQHDAVQSHYGSFVNQLVQVNKPTTSKKQAPASSYPHKQSVDQHDSVKDLTKTKTPTKPIDPINGILNTIGENSKVLARPLQPIEGILNSFGKKFTSLLSHHKKPIQKPVITSAVTVAPNPSIVIPSTTYTVPSPILSSTIYQESQTNNYDSDLEKQLYELYNIQPDPTVTPTVTSILSTLTKEHHTYIVPMSTNQQYIVPSSAQQLPIATHYQPALIEISPQDGSFSSYGEDCQCVPEHYCNANDILTRLSPTDINYPFDPRSDVTEILSNSTDAQEFSSKNGNNGETERNRRDVLGDEHDSKIHTSIVGVSINSYTPGQGGCSGNHVCCRSPLTAPKRTKYTCGKKHANSLLGRINRPKAEQGDTDFAEYPWQAAILRRNNSDSIYVCGAVLIDNWHVLTAVHCLYGLHYFDLKVRLGEWDVASSSEFYNHVELEVTTIVRHPNFYKGNLENDIAVLRLSASVDFENNPHISPVCLPSPSSDYINQTCTVTGWGKDAFGSSGKFQRILKEVSVPVMEQNKCQDSLRQTRLGPSFTLQDGMMCAGGEQDKDACKGDGGSPLVCLSSSGSYELAGLVSWGISCGLEGIPGVYVDVQHYLPWITAVQHS